MSDTSIIALLASVGILLTGTITADAAALASAVKAGTPDELVGFVRANPESEYAPDALLMAARLSEGRLESTAASAANPELTCKLTIQRVGDDKAVVRWSSTGAAAIGLHPLGFAAGSAVPAAGEKTIPAVDFQHITMTLMDKQGNKVKCTVFLGGAEIDPATDLSGPGIFVASLT